MSNCYCHPGRAGGSPHTLAWRRGAETLWERMDADGRAGALKTDWTEPPQDAGAMGIEWLAEP
jgi:hypothetical protein